MALEGTVNYIDDLNSAWPIGNIDTLDESDNHHRITKVAVKGSFPNLGQAAVTLTAAQINALQNSTNPVGAIIMYNASFSAIPSGWQLCDGTNGTPNMADKFVYGTNTEGSLEGTGGSANAVNVSHNHTANHDHPAATSTSAGGHSHTVAYTTGTGSSGTTIFGSNAAPDNSSKTTSTVAAHTHSTNIPNMAVTTSTDGVSGTNANIPPYVKLAYIQRMS